MDMGLAEQDAVSLIEVGSVLISVLICCRILLIGSPVAK